MTFKTFKEIFIKKRRVEVLSYELAPSTLHSDLIRLGILLPRFARLDIRDIKSQQVDGFLDFLILEGKSPATRNRYRALLHTIFEYAIRMGLAKKNPVTDIPILSEKMKSRAVGNWRTMIELDAYIDFAFQRREVLGIAAAILCLGGCRVSEMMALKWRDISWDKGVARIRRIIERHTNTVQTRTKSQRAGGEYSMILFPRLKFLLQDWYKKTPLKDDDDFVVHNIKGEHFSYDLFEKHHYKIIAAAGLKRITPHDLRRTFATIAEKSGYSRGDIIDLLGHETSDTVDTYLPKDMDHLVQKGMKIGFGRW